MKTQTRRPLRWLMIATHVPPTGSTGGMVRYAVELAEALHARDDVELYVLVTPEAAPFFTDLLGSVERIRTTPGRIPTLARSALERGNVWMPALQEPWDVIHGTKQILPRRVRARRVLTVHDLMMLDRPDDFPLLKRQLLPRPYLASIREADALLCVSAATRARLLAYEPAAAAKAHVVPLASSTSLARVTPEPVPQLEQQRFALVVGDQSPRKNVGFALRLWQDLVAELPDATLAVVGPPGWGVNEATELPGHAKGRIEMLGHVSDAQLRWCYEHATVVLCPSRQEGFGLPALEAVQFAAPVITSTDPALMEASGDHADHVSLDAPEQWRSAVIAAFAKGRSRLAAAPTLRTWADVAAGSVAAVAEPVKPVKPVTMA
jgi:glycosyltransferase involved in cell wall biosynthesis